MCLYRSYTAECALQVFQVKAERNDCGQKWSRGWLWAHASGSRDARRNISMSAKAVVTQTLFTELVLTTLGLFLFPLTLLALHNIRLTSWMRWANLELQPCVSSARAAISLKYHYFCNFPKLCHALSGFCAQSELSAGFHWPFQYSACNKTMFIQMMAIEAPCFITCKQSHFYKQINQSEVVNTTIHLQRTKARWVP